MGQSESERIGEGTYGTVFKRQREGEAVAVKVCKSSRNKSEGVPLAAYRELLALRRLSSSKSPFLVELHAIGIEEGHVSFTLGYMESTLSSTLSERSHLLSIAAVQHVLVQCARALQFMHSEYFIHRDISPSNVLVSVDLSEVRIADLGMSRSFLSPATQLGKDGEVVKLHYRSPELLLGCNTYGPPIDIWSLGCILVEMLARKGTLFRGKPAKGQPKVEVDQLCAIARVLGAPDVYWPDVTKLEHWAKASTPIRRVLEDAPQCGDGLRKYFKDNHVSEEVALRLANQLLQYDPRSRLTASAILSSAFCQEQFAQSLATPLSTRSDASHNAAIASTKEWSARKTRKGYSAAVDEQANESQSSEVVKQDELR